MRHLVFDVESIGLHGEHFAVGWVIYDHGKLVENDWVACPSTFASGTAEGRRWIEQNLPEDVIDPPIGPHLVANTRGVREAFWHLWSKERNNGTKIWADVAWPVEARFLIACIEDGREAEVDPRTLTIPPTDREFQGPYPVLDIRTIYSMCANPPSYPEMRGPVHHPMYDAWRSAELLLLMLEQGTTIRRQ